MARAQFAKKTRKAIPDAGIKVGDSYYWWKFRFGGKRYSKTAPKRSQLTQSDFYGQIYDIEDEIAELDADDSLPSCVEDIASRIREIGDECEEKRGNMPEQLQDSASGELLQERKDACDSAADELEAIDFGEFEPDEEETTKARAEDKDAPEVNDEGATEEEYWQAKLEEVQDISIDAP